MSSFKINTKGVEWTVLRVRVYLYFAKIALMQQKICRTHSCFFILTAHYCQCCLRMRQIADFSAAKKTRRLQKLFELNLSMIHLIWSVANFYNGSCHYGQWPLQLACIIIFHKDLPRAFLLLLQLGTSWATKNVKKISNLLCIMRLLSKKIILCPKSINSTIKIMIKSTNFWLVTNSRITHAWFNLAPQTLLLRDKYW